MKNRISEINFYEMITWNIAQFGLIREGEIKNVFYTHYSSNIWRFFFLFFQKKKNHKLVNFTNNYKEKVSDIELNNSDVKKMNSNLFSNVPRYSKLWKIYFYSV